MQNSCEDIRTTLMTYLDDELETADQQQFEDHVSGCSSCSALLEEEKGWHTELREKLQASVALPDSLWERVTQGLDGEDADLRDRRRSRALHSVFPVFAATLAAAALLLFVWSEVRAPSTPAAPSRRVSRDAAREHLQGSPLFVSQDRASVRQGAARYLAQPVRTPQFFSKEIRLLGWTPGRLAGKPSAVFVYQLRDRSGLHRINVHLVDRSVLDIESLTPVRASGIELRATSAFGLQTVIFAGSGDVAYVFTSDLPLDRLATLAAQSDVVNVLDNRLRKRR